MGKRFRVKFPPGWWVQLSQCFALPHWHSRVYICGPQMVETCQMTSGGEEEKSYMVRREKPADANRRLKSLGAVKCVVEGRRALGPAVVWSWEVAEQGRVLGSRARARSRGKCQRRRQTDRAEGCRELLNRGAAFQLPIRWWCLVLGRPIPKASCGHVPLLLLRVLSAGVFSLSLHTWPDFLPLAHCQPCPLLFLACLPELFCAALQRGSGMPLKSRERCHGKKAREWCNEKVEMCRGIEELIPAVNRKTSSYCLGKRHCGWDPFPTSLLSWALNACSSPESLLAFWETNT